MQGTISHACKTGDIKIHWTEDSVWFDFEDATSREKKSLRKYITMGRKRNKWDAYLCNKKGEKHGEALTAFPKKDSRLVIIRKTFEIKNIIEGFVNEEIESMGHLVFEMKGKEGRLLRSGEFKVKDKKELKKEGKDKQEVVDAKRPGGG